MIITKHRKETVAIKQEDHAEFAAFMLERWGDHGFRHDPKRDAIVMATREHDNGWREYDAAPRINPKTKLPVDFKSTSPEETFDIWLRGSRRFIDEEPYVALLITHHAYSLHEHTHNRSGAWKEFFITLAKQRGLLRDSLGMTHNDVEHGYSFLRMMDWFSLMFCSNRTLGHARPAQYAGYKVKRDEDTFLFRPFPFADRELHYTMPVYVLKSRSYATTADVQRDLETPESWEIVISPLEL